jgi:hypothetical protein
MAFSTNGAERIRINSSGNVSIGTDSPVCKLHLQNQDSSDTTVLRLENKPSTAATNAVAMEFWGNEGTVNNGVYNMGKIYGHFDGSNYSDTRLTLGSAAGNGSFNDELTLKYGSVGISTASPNTQLHIYKASTNAHHDHIKLEMASGWAGSQNKFKSIVWNDGTSNVGGIGMTYDGTTTNMHFHSMYNGGYKSESDEVFSILGSGKVGINDSSPTQALEVVDSNNYKGIHIRGSVAPCLTFAQGTSTTPSWRVGVSGYDGTAYTVATGASVGDKIHIKPAGHFIVNGTANQANGSCTFQVTSTGVTISNNKTTGASHGNEFQTFRRGGTQIGSIYMNGTTQVGYSTTSDYRLKENVDYTWDATENLKRLKPAKFNFIADTEDLTIHGFLAHEVADIIPEAVSGNKDATETINNVVLDSDNNIIARDISEEDWTIGKNEDIYPSDSTWSETHASPKYQQLDQSKLIPLLVKTIQEQQTIIDDLKSRVETLENN